ncbi:MAG: autotransporter-associated beta strand repeat-containing protein [Pirellulales bacterium]|nr:autotransporter-associated beta strand repeat-containing protein [Pirellulales bacterium]
MRRANILLLVGVFLAAVLADSAMVRGVTVSVPTTLSTPGTYNKLTFTLHAETSVGSPSSTRVIDMTGDCTANLIVDFNAATRAPTVTQMGFTEYNPGHVYLNNNDPKGDFKLTFLYIFTETISMSGLRATPLTPGSFAPVTGTSFDMNNHQVRINSGTFSWSGIGDPGSRDCASAPITVTPPVGSIGTLQVTKRSGYDTWTSSSYNVHLLAPISFTDEPVTSGNAPIIGDYTVTDSGSGTMESSGTFTQSFAPTAAYWDTSTTSGLQAGSGTWSTAATNWSPFASGGDSLLGWYSAGGSSLDVYFNANGSSTVTLVQNVAAKSLTFNGSGYTIAGSGSYTLTLTTGTITANQNAIVSAPLAGSNGLTKEGMGKLTLTGDNTFSGGATIHHGTLALAGGGQLSTSILNNAAFEISDGVASHAVGAITGTGTTQVLGAGQLISPSITQGTLSIGGSAAGSNAHPVPEPSLLLLLTTAGLGILWAMKVRK